MKYRMEVFSYKGRKALVWMKVLLALGLAGVLAFFGSFALVMHGAHDLIHGEPETMVILGCQVKPWGPSILLQDRLEKALEYLEDHPEMTVVVSGGQGPDEPTTEAEAMADYLVEQGVSPEQILLEENSHNTLQNLRYSRTLLKENGYRVEDGAVLIVSNGFHLTRVRMLAQREGYGEVSTLAAPSSHLPSRLKMYVREPLALAKSFLLDR